MSEVAWVQTATTIITICGFLFQWLREARNHKWDLQDRESARRDINIMHSENRQDIAQNTRLTIEASAAAGAAYEAANNTNIKIRGLNQKLVDLDARYDIIKPIPEQVQVVVDKVDRVLTAVEKAPPPNAT